MINLKRSYKLPSKAPVDLRIIAAIPCYNTQTTIGDVVSRTREYVDEVVVIDDGSTDMTRDVAELAGAKVISHLKNKGYGEAIKSCIVAARDAGADILITIDGDGQHDANEIPLLMDQILQNKAELVIGSRFLKKNKQMPSYRKLGINIINFLWNFGSRTKVTDTQSGFRAYNRNVLDKMFFSEKGMGISIEILEKARKKGIKITEAPISCSYIDNNSTLSNKAIWHGLSVAFSVLKLRLKREIAKNERPELLDIQKAFVH
jgi:glycosyltransferase involved in cell wall biosynthesis